MRIRPSVKTGRNELAHNALKNPQPGARAKKEGLTAPSLLLPFPVEHPPELPEELEAQHHAVVNGNGPLGIVYPRLQLAAGRYGSKQVRHILLDSSLQLAPPLIHKETLPLYFRQSKRSLHHSCVSASCTSRKRFPKNLAIGSIIHLRLKT